MKRQIFATPITFENISPGRCHKTILEKVLNCIVFIKILNVSLTFPPQNNSTCCSHQKKSFDQSQAGVDDFLLLLVKSIPSSFEVLGRTEHG